MIQTDILLILVLSGVLVGFVNTLAGGASVISMAVFMALGLPVGLSNGTNRIAVLSQNLTSALTFHKYRLFPFGLGLKMAIPAVIGNVIGSHVATEVDDRVFRICLMVILFLMLVFMALDSVRHIRRFGKHDLRLRWWHYPIFLAIGFYSGFIYIGIGYLLLVVMVMCLHLDLVTANALKGFILTVSTPFSLAIFMYNGQIDYLYGLLHAVGNVVGAYFAARYAVKWGSGFVKIFMALIVLLFMADLFGFISLHEMVLSLVDRI